MNGYFKVGDKVKSRPNRGLGELTGKIIDVKMRYYADFGDGLMEVSPEFFEKLENAQDTGERHPKIHH